MSSIQFHTLSDEPLHVAGAERPHAAGTAVETTMSVLGASAPLVVATAGCVVIRGRVRYALRRFW